MPHTLSMADIHDCQGVPLASHSHAEWFPTLCASVTGKQPPVTHPFSCFWLFPAIPGLPLHSLPGRELQTGCHSYKTCIHINSHICICICVILRAFTSAYWACIYTCIYYIGHFYAFTYEVFPCICTPIDSHM